MLHVFLSRSGPTLVAGLLFLALFAGCDSAVEEPEAEAEACVPQCEERCDGDDGCGGVCDCPRVDECAGRCAEHESCVGSQCVCEPDCADKACQADGCGGQCACPDGYVQNAQGDWVPRAQCTDTCESAAFACGSVCGETCGTCDGDSACSMGQCGCAPRCDGTSCNDGCGGSCACAAGNVCDPSGACVPQAACDDTCESQAASCGTVCGATCGSCEGSETCSAGKCVEGVSCASCSMRLVLLDKKVVDGRLLEVTVGLDYEPKDQEEKPRLLDLRLRAGAAARLVDAQPGAALTSTNKSLYRDGASGNNFRKHGDGSYQLLVFSIGDTDPVGVGRMATLKFSVASSSPWAVHLVRRLESAAPAPADAVLQSTSYDQSLVVSP
jgi:hypothetical protein